MRTYSFTLILAGLDEATDEAAEAIYEAVCDDSVFASRDGVASIHFAREAKSLEEAIRSAIADVRNAGFEVSRAEVDVGELERAPGL